MGAEKRPDAADHAWAIGIFEDEDDAMRARFDRPVVNADDARRGAEKRPGDGNCFPFGDRGKFEQIGVIARRAEPRFRDLQA